jgi:hypothetical protein
MASLIASGICALSAAGFALAIDNLSFTLEGIEGAGWRAANVEVRLDLPDRTRASAHIDRLVIDDLGEELRGISIRCADVELSAASLACPDAQIAGTFGSLGKQNVRGSVRYGRSDGALVLDLKGLSMGSGQASMRASLSDAGWHARMQLSAIELQSLLDLARHWKVAPEDWSAAGSVSGHIEVSGAQSAPREANADLRFDALTVNNAQGTVASDKLSFSTRLQASRRQDVWHFLTAVQSSAGQAYVEPVFLDFGARAIDVSAQGAWNSGMLTLDRFLIGHEDVLQAEGSAHVAFAAQQPLRSLELNLRGLKFPGAYESYLQPFLLDTSFKALKSTGEISGQLSVRDGTPQKIDLKFADVSLDDGQRTLAMSGISGDWHWSHGGQSAGDDEADAARQSSRIQWRSGVLLNLDLGASRLEFETHGLQFRLLERASIPLLDGAIDLESFRVRNLGEPTVAFMVDAVIRPISASRLCRAFGWPEFGGRVGGTISKLRLRDNMVTLGTTLQAQVFDGSIRISDLRLEQPFSQWPRFAANIAMEQLDLNLVTSAFSFGGMTGRLSGEINGLKLFNWQPVAFDAKLYTPADDRSRHRISQRAVQNIGSIGGGGAGVTAALSGGVMKFFDDFNYDRLGLSCRLENEVCVLDGVAPAPNGGYYLVKGKGLPRIDVIGTARRVDWPRLVEQLIAVTQSEGPVIE